MALTFGYYSGRTRMGVLNMRAELAEIQRPQQVDRSICCDAWRETAFVALSEALSLNRSLCCIYNSFLSSQVNLLSGI